MPNYKGYKFRFVLFEHHIPFSKDNQNRPCYEFWENNNRKYLTLVINDEIITLEVNFKTTLSQSDTLVICSIYYRTWEYPINSSTLAKLGIDSHSEFLQQVGAILGFPSANDEDARGIKIIRLGGHYNSSQSIYAES